MTWFDPGYSFIHTAPPWGEMGWEGCGCDVSINMLPPASRREAPGSTLFPRRSPWTWAGGPCEGCGDAGAPTWAVADILWASGGGDMGGASRCGAGGLPWAPAPAHQ